MIGVRNYAIVTSAYWAFTITDGALRLLVLLHFHGLGYTPVQLAFLFLLYEFFGIVTNLVGGWLAARTGLRFTLVAGLALQTVALGLLALLNREWTMGVSVLWNSQEAAGPVDFPVQPWTKPVAKDYAAINGECRV